MELRVVPVVASGPALPSSSKAVARTVTSPSCSVERSSGRLNPPWSSALVRPVTGAAEPGEVAVTSTGEPAAVDPLTVLVGESLVLDDAVRPVIEGPVASFDVLVSAVGPVLPATSVAVAVTVTGPSASVERSSSKENPPLSPAFVDPVVRPPAPSVAMTATVEPGSVVPLTMLRGAFWVTCVAARPLTVGSAVSLDSSRTPEDGPPLWAVSVAFAETPSVPSRKRVLSNTSPYDPVSLVVVVRDSLVGSVEPGSVPAWLPVSVTTTVESFSAVPFTDTAPWLRALIGSVTSVIAGAAGAVWSLVVSAVPEVPVLPTPSVAAARTVIGPSASDDRSSLVLKRPELGVVVPVTRLPAASVAETVTVDPSSAAPVTVLDGVAMLVEVAATSVTAGPPASFDVVVRAA